MTKSVPAGAFALAQPVARPALILPPSAMPRAIVGGQVRADVSNPAEMFAQLQRAFDTFKAENDKRLGDIEKGRGDPLQAEKVDKISTDLGALQAALDEINRRLTAQALAGGAGGGRVMTAEQADYTEKFHAFFRRGAGEAELKALAVKAQLSRLSDPDGGYVVSPEIEQTIDRVLGTVSTMRMLATVRPTGAANYKKRVGLGGAGAGWVGEEETRNETSTPRMAQLEFPSHTLYAEPEATEEMLEDADFDIAAWLADEVNITFEEQEGAAHWTGNGVKRPRGLLDYDTVEDDNWAWGKIGFRASGHATTIPNADACVNLTESLKQGFRQNASWVANRKTWTVLRTLKDGEGRYLWQPSLQLGKPSSFLGYADYADDNLPDVGAGAFPVAFGDFKRGYLILDRRGVRVLRNPFKTSGFVTFYTTKRTGGGVQHFQAMKLLKISA